MQDEGRDMDGSDRLAGIRRRIDAIDAEMHRLLIARGAVIDELIGAKGTEASGAAFRPGREAAMMRRLVSRHEGRLPLASVEHIWREIITTFTFMQAPFGVAVAPAADRLAMRDLVRFYFGFSVPLSECASAEEAVARVAGAGDLAVVPVAGGGLWWRELAKTDGARIFARLPAIEADRHPAALPAYVVGPPLGEDSDLDLAVLVLEATGGDLEAAVAIRGGRVVAGGPDHWLAELPLAVTLEDIAEALSEAGGALVSAERIGALAAPIEVLAAAEPAPREAAGAAR